jgi:hypothetical protein
MSEDKLKLLQSYLDTGLTPEEIASIKEALDLSRAEVQGLSERVVEAQKETEQQFAIREAWTKTAENLSRQNMELGLKLAEWQRLEEQGLLVRLPCKANDTLYWITEQKVIKAEVMAISIEVGEKGTEYIFVEYKTDGWGNGVFITKNFGKTVFLTRAEAEAKLKGGAE